MNDAITNILSRIKINIPPEILDVSFTPNKRHMSLDTCILEDVIYKRLMPDANLVSGEVTDIYLQPEWVEVSQLPISVPLNIGESYNIYRIPPFARENRNINSVISCRYPSTLYSNGIGSVTFGNYGQNTLGDLAASMVSGHTWQNMSVNPKPILVAGDIVKLTPIVNTWATMQSWLLTCRLEFDDDFTNLSNSAILALCEMAVCLTKAHIYNTNIIRMDKMYTEFGQELGEVKNVISNWSGELERYEELLRNFHGVATVLDKKKMNRVLLEYL